MVITDCDKNKNDTAIHQNINNKQMKVSKTTVQAELRQKHGRREHV